MDRWIIEHVRIYDDEYEQSFVICSVTVLDSYLDVVCFDASTLLFRFSNGECCNKNDVIVVGNALVRVLVSERIVVLLNPFNFLCSRSRF